MRKVVIFTMVLTLIFAMAGCTAHSEPDIKVAESSSSNTLIDTTQLEKLPEKTENETIEESTFAEETTQSPDAETGTEKVSKEPIISQITTANNEPKQDTHTQEKTPESEIMSLKLQQILLRKSQQQLNKLKDLIYRIGFLMHRIMLKV